VGDIARVFPDGGKIGAEELVQGGLVRKGKLVKVLGNGDVNGVKLDITADAFSGSAKVKLEAAGGSATTN
jgi:large subunit ribosomal protein L15